MQNIKNNIFTFATKELSQDAVICWILSFIKYPDSELYGLSVELFKLLGCDDIDSNQKIDIKTQVNKADIVVVLHSLRQIIIIEDKVYSSVHDDQIRVYKKAFQKLENQKKYLGIESNTAFTVKTVYFKTGYLYDVDLIVKTDVDRLVSGMQFLNIVSREQYRNKSEILDAYVEHLTGLVGWYDENGDYQNEDNVKKHNIAQRNLMRTLFPEEKWNIEKKSKAFMVEVGTSSGIPYSQMRICEDRCYEGENDSYQIFWRIDRNKNGAYLSLRFYEKFNKNDEDKLTRHAKMYQKYLTKCNNIVNELQGIIDLCWTDIENGNKGNCYESSLLTIQLSKYLEKWNTKGENLIRDVNLITDEFLKTIND